MPGTVHVSHTIQDEILIAIGIVSDLVSKLHLTFCFLGPFLLPTVPVCVLLAKTEDAKTVRNARNIWGMGRSLMIGKKGGSRMGRASLRPSEVSKAKILY